MDILKMRLEAPLLSFGGTSIDNIGPSLRFPPKTLIAGLIGNALGYKREDASSLEELEKRIRFVAFEEKAGEKLQDYQTTYLGQDFMNHKTVAWTTWGYIQERGGGPENQTGTDIRYRDYLQDEKVCVHLTVKQPDKPPTLVDIAEALKKPYRPLFIGRKPCIPSSPIVDEKALFSSRSLSASLEQSEIAQDSTVYFQRGSLHENELSRFRIIEEIPFSESRDWRNRTHTGRSSYVKAKVHS